MIVWRYYEKNIKIVRLTTGEDLIGEVQEGSGIVNIKKLT